ncbi:hypothetical protein AA313_de0205393 [Arthrobotrys entomopaga]|nr:hypothetical protein AA313_de0205393 [Arthrobotrys entomopaga]
MFSTFQLASVHPRHTPLQTQIISMALSENQTHGLVVVWVIHILLLVHIPPQRRPGHRAKPNIRILCNPKFHITLTSAILTNPPSTIHALTMSDATVTSHEKRWVRPISQASRSARSLHGARYGRRG